MKRGNKLLCAALPHQAALPEVDTAGWGTQEGMGEDTVVATSLRGSQRDSSSLEGVLCSLFAVWWDVWLSHGGIRAGMGLRSPLSGQVKVLLILTPTLPEISKNIIQTCVSPRAEFTTAHLRFFLAPTSVCTM